MNIPTKNIQIIKKNGVPVFVLVPYEEYFKTLPEEDTIPNEVVELIIKKNFNLLKAWRTYLKLTQKEVAEKAKITQSALSQMEKNDNIHRTTTLVKLANAMNLSVKQLED